MFEKNKKDNGEQQRVRAEFSGLGGVGEIKNDEVGSEKSNAHSRKVIFHGKFIFYSKCHWEATRSEGL